MINWILNHPKITGTLTAGFLIAVYKWGLPAAIIAVWGVICLISSIYILKNIKEIQKGRQNLKPKP